MNFGSAYDVDFIKLNPAAQAAVMNRLVQSGIGWLRVDVSRDGGAWWTEPVIRAARAAGIKVEALLTDFDDVIGDPQAVAAFAGQAVTKYAPLGVDTYEVGNELNYRIDAAQYTRLLQASYRAIKAVNPLSTVLVGGLGAADGSAAPATYLAAMYAAGAKDYFTAMNVHPYSFPDLPTQADSWNLFYTLPQLYQVMVDHGDGGKQIWLTEYGVPTQGNPTGNGSVNEVLQAQMITDAFSRVKQLPWAGPLFVFNWIDSGDGAFGMLRADGSAKPALAALLTAAAP